MWGPGYGYGGAGWLGMGLMMLFGFMLLVGLVLLVVWIARGSDGERHHAAPQTRDRSCDIVRERYARGEITKEQYEETCRTLGV